MTRAELLRFPINDSSVYELILVEADASFMSVVQAVFLILLGTNSESECLCTTLGMSCARLVFLPLPVSLRRVYCLVSGVLMDVVVGIVYG